MVRGMDLTISTEQTELLSKLDHFVESEIKPLEEEHEEFFNHRRESERTNWDVGTPSAEWEVLLEKMRTKAEEAGFYRLPLPRDLGGQECSTLTETLAKEHLASKGPGLHAIAHTGLAWETVVGNWRNVNALYSYGTAEQKEQYLDGLLSRDVVMAFGMTEPNHGSDPTYMETTAERVDDGWRISGKKRFVGAMHSADVIRLFARTSGEPGSADGITTFLVPTDAEGFNVEYFHWTSNLPTTQAEIEINDVFVPEEAVLGTLDEGIKQGREFLLKGWLEQATMALGTAQYCIDEIVDYANERETFGKPLSHRQGIQFPTVDLYTEIELVRNLVYKVAWMIDEGKDQRKITELVSMANYRANQLANDTADQAMQVYGGKGWTRHYPFEYLYRQYRRYRITEGADEIQKRRIAGTLFGFI